MPAIVVIDTVDPWRARRIGASASAAGLECALFVGEWRPAGAWPEDDVRWDGYAAEPDACGVLLLHHFDPEKSRASKIAAGIVVRYSGGGIAKSDVGEIWIDRNVRVGGWLPSSDDISALFNWAENQRSASNLPPFASIIDNSRLEMLVTLATLCAGHLIASGSLPPEWVTDSVPPALVVNHHVSAARDSWRTRQTDWWSPLLLHPTYALSAADGVAIGELMAILRSPEGASGLESDLLAAALRESRSAIHGTEAADGRGWR